MSMQHKLLIMDDDLHYSGMLALRLRRYFPEIKVSSISNGNCINGYDIYILDNDFNGEKKGAALAEELREKEPTSLIIILSATLEKSMLIRLVNCHAAGVFDKGELTELEPLFELIEDYIAKPALGVLPQQGEETTIFSGISSVLSQWNKRLEMERQ